MIFDKIQDGCLVEVCTLGVLSCWDLLLAAEIVRGNEQRYNDFTVMLSVWSLFLVSLFHHVIISWRNWSLIFVTQWCTINQRALSLPFSRLHGVVFWSHVVVIIRKHASFLLVVDNELRNFARLHFNRFLLNNIHLEIRSQRSQRPAVELFRLTVLVVISKCNARARYNNE